MTAKTWIKKFISISILLILSLCIGAYIFDPYNYFRIDKENKILNNRFCNIGLIKNYSYDTAIIGSSITQNFDVDYVNNQLKYNSLKVNIGSMTFSETAYFMNKISIKTCKNVIVSVDLWELRTPYSGEMRNIFPDYLYNDRKIDDIKYLLSYEVWCRFIPFNCSMNIGNKYNLLPAALSQKWNNRIFIKKIGYWADDYKFGEEIVLKNYKKKNYTTNIVARNDFLKNYKKKVNSFFSAIENNLLNSKQKVIFFFPPYSGNFWFNAEKENICDVYWIAKKYFLQKASSYENVRVVDMQDMNEISDLNHYRDSIHYDLIIQNKIVDAIKDRNMELTVNNFDVKKRNWESQMKKFKKRYKDIL